MPKSIISVFAEGQSATGCPLSGAAQPARPAGSVLT